MGQKAGEGKASKCIASCPKWQEKNLNSIKKLIPLQGEVEKQTPPPPHPRCALPVQIQRKFSLSKFGDRFSSENIGRPINQTLERFQYALAHLNVHSVSKYGIALGLQKLAAAQHRNQAEKENLF